MKKLFTLMMLMVLSVGYAWAGDIFTWYFNDQKQEVQSVANFFTHPADGKFNYNTNYGGTYKDVTCAGGLKLEGTTKLQFTTTSTSKITIVQSLKKNPANCPKFDGTILSAENRVDNTANNAGVFTLENIDAGEHSIERGAGEGGIFYIEVEYTGESKILLSNPNITFDASSGEVTIQEVENATEIRYTTDGTNPSSDNGNIYNTPFVAEEGTIVKAIAIGDGNTTINSGITEITIILTGIELQKPTIKSQNGSVAITCGNPNVTIEYSTDGISFQPYTRSFTLTEDATVYARASREGCTSSEAKVEVKAVPKNLKSKTIYMGWNSFTVGTVDGLSTLTGNAGTDAEGYSLVLTKADKAWTPGNTTITTGKNTYPTIKLSNGAQNKIILPVGVKATKLTLYSTVNAASGARLSGWQEINGETFDVNEVPMGAYNNVGDCNTNPDFRIFPLDNVEGEITFTNGGEQLLFTIVLDVLEPINDITLNTSGYATYSNANTVTIEGATAYTSKADEANSELVLTELGTVIPAGEGVILKGEAGATVTFTYGGEAPAIETNDFKAALTEDAVAGNVYVLKSDKFVKYTGATLTKNKAYILMSDEFGTGSNARPMSIVFGGDTNGITTVKNTVVADDAPTFNLNGQRVAEGTKGLLIKNGKKLIVK
ncbi:MAG: chitobiase/beta-hexosaminidase C-terminal domain-containing protein [Prevotella sp.]|nr:chitobiase/beta-hexosaminidase C-terminal domain-containing protein [Prevotella sp.]